MSAPDGVGGKVHKGGRKSNDHHADAKSRPPTRRGNTRPKRGRTKTPAGARFVALPPRIAVLYEELMDGHREPDRSRPTPAARTGSGSSTAATGAPRACTSRTVLGQPRSV